MIWQHFLKAIIKKFECACANLFFDSKAKNKYFASRISFTHILYTGTCEKMHFFWNFQKVTSAHARFWLSMRRNENKINSIRCAMGTFLCNPLRPRQYFHYFSRKPRNSTAHAQVKISIWKIDNFVLGPIPLRSIYNMSTYVLPKKCSTGTNTQTDKLLLY